jgi:type VI secretion system protein VasG
MAYIDLKQLVAKLNSATRTALEGAVALCVTRTNYNVEIEHWLFKLLEQPNSDFVVLLRQCGVDASRLTADLTRAMDGFRTGSSRAPALSPDVVALIRESWLIASIDYGSSVARSAHILCALVRDESLARLAVGASREFAKVQPDALLGYLPHVLPKTDEATQGPGRDEAPVAGAPRGATSTAALDQFTIDLTQRAREGHIDPVLGRDAELRQIVDILMRRRQNNPILTGEAGVGKTAVVEGFAQRIADGDVPPSLLHVGVRTLDLGLLQAGAGVKGEFENRL